MKNFIKKPYNFNANSIEGFKIINDNFDWLSVYSDKRTRKVRKTPLFALFLHRLSGLDKKWNAKQSSGINYAPWGWAKAVDKERDKKYHGTLGDLTNITPFLTTEKRDELGYGSKDCDISSEIKRKRWETKEVIKEAGLQLKKQWKLFKSSLNNKQEKQAIQEIKKQIQTALNQEKNIIIQEKIFPMFQDWLGRYLKKLGSQGWYFPDPEMWDQLLSDPLPPHPGGNDSGDKWQSLKFFFFLKQELARITLLEKNDHSKEKAEEEMSDYIHDLFVSQYIYTSHQLYQAREDIYESIETYKEFEKERNNPDNTFIGRLNPHSRLHLDHVNNVVRRFSSAIRSPIGIWLEIISKIKLDYENRLHIIFNSEFDNSKKFNDFILRLPKHIKESLYTNFTINKKSGKVREICAPKRRLKKLQRELLFFLNLFYKPNSNIHGFIQNRSIISNAKIHKNKKYLLNVDIQDFFPAITFGRVRAVLQLSPFNFSTKEAHVIANACTLDGILPQGSPTSPIISNIVSQRLDSKLRILAREYRCQYTRYGDDITFSSNNELFNEQGYLKLLKKLTKEIKKEGFEINNDKTRFQTNVNRQSVTGLIVNRKVNISRKYVKTIRAMLHHWRKDGLHLAQLYFEDFYINQDIEKNKLIRKQNSINSSDKHNFSFLSSLAGRIEFMGSVRGKDILYQKYHDQYKELYKRDKSANIKSSDIILSRFYKDTINPLDFARKNSPLELQRVLRNFRGNSHPFKYLLHPLSADSKYRGEDGSFLYKKLRSDCIKEIDNLTTKRIISKDIISLISSYINDEIFPDPIHKFNVDEKYNLQSGWYSYGLKRIIEKTKKHPLDTKIDDSLNENERSVVKEFEKSVKAFNEAFRFDHFSFKDMITQINEEYDFDIDYKYDPAGDYLVSNNIFYDSYRFKRVISSLVFRNQYIEDGKNLIVTMDQEEYNKETETTKINVKIRHTGATPNRPSDSFINYGGDTNNYISDLRNLCDFSIQAKYIDGEYKIDYLSMTSEKREKHCITKKSSKEFSKMPSYVEFIFSFYTENKWRPEKKVKETMEALKESENSVKQRDSIASKICLLDDKYLDHSQQNLKQLQKKYKKFINDFLAIYQSHNEIKNGLSNFKCVMIHSSYQPLEEFDNIRNFCIENRILFVQFGGGETESGKINDQHYTINSTLFFDNLESFLSYYDKEKVLRPELLLE